MAKVSPLDQADTDRAPACPICDAPPYQWCRSEEGNPIRAIHAGRLGLVAVRPSPDGHFVGVTVAPEPDPPPAGDD